jgi:RHH-type transcriptional regulator, proline utilization regulon repressor / proline dehydrogenase / delta 1-pyrroline-5-carboxylate dehydrogenase
MNQSAANGLEELTRAYGSEIFARLNRTGPIPFSPAWFDDQMMALSMADQAIKVQLFRFIDALPLLKTPDSIARHLQEYFAEVSDRLPAALRFLLRRLPADGAPGRLLAWLARVNAERLAHKFMAGSNLPEALQAIARLRQHHFAFTIDLLGEATITETEADEYAHQYLDLIAGLTREVNAWPEDPLIDRDQSGPIPRVNVSVKLSSLYSQFDPIDPAGTSRAVCNRLRPILKLARANGAFVNFDMEQFAFKDETLRIFHEILMEPAFRDWPHVGIAMQAYLLDTERDLQQLLDWVKRRGTSVWVRLVKGAYWDYETVIAAQNYWPTPVFTQKWQTDAHYETLTRFLLENHEHLRPAFGSHNIRSIAFAMALAHQMELPKGSFEFQMLYGMADPVKDALAGMGQRLRIYAPFGQLLPGMAYLVRRLLENTSNESFLRASFQEHKPEVQLLMNPRSHASHLLAAENESNHHGFQNEPVSDFSREENRRAMQDALRDVAAQFGRYHSLMINGEEKPGGGQMASHNPSHWEQIVGTFALARKEDAEAAIAAAHAALSSWRDTPAEERAQFLFVAAQKMRRRRFELSAWEVHECGKPWREADADVAEAIDFCEYYAREMIRLANAIRHDLPGEDNEYFYEPRGVTVVIAPWNFPLAILCGMTTAALVAGNPVIMKPAEQSSVVAAKLMDIFRDVGLPKGVLHFLPGIGEEVGPTLVNHRDVALIAFTGSRGVGLAINYEASATPPGQEHVKRVIAEMGGKNAIIVDADADLDEAVKGVVESAFVYAGQKCSACSRAVVLEPIYDAFLRRLIEATRSLKMAPADDPGCFVGPVIDMEARDRILGMIEKGKQEAKLAFAADAGALAQQGSFVPPHVFADVSPHAMIAREEIFGPVLSVIRARDLNEALNIANGTSYALTGGLFSRSPESIRRVRREFRVGNLYINRKITGALVERQPFGGFKLSGIGSKAGGPDYLLQFLLPRSITENTMRHGFTPVPSDASAKHG